MTWLVTGGAGYIGSHIVRAFGAAGTPVVVLDNLATGYRDFVPSGVPFVQGSITDADVVARVLRDYDVTGVVHLAGLKYAGVSVDHPLEYFRENVSGTQVLLDAVVARGIDRFLFSSSAAWYGTPDVDVVTEDAPARPGEPVRADEGRRRMVAAVGRAGEPGPAPGLVALLQRGWFGDTRAGRPQPAQPASRRCSRR